MARMHVVEGVDKVEDRGDVCMCVTKTCVRNEDVQRSDEKAEWCGDKSWSLTKRPAIRAP